MTDRTSCYTERAQDTKARRRKAGMYRKPTRDQREAMGKYMSGVGVEAMSASECVLLGDHPYLTPTQRIEWMGRAFAKGWQ
jgi:hypothetical protein